MIESVIFDWGGVLIDDDSKYTDAAKQAGLNTILFRSIGRLKKELARR